MKTALELAANSCNALSIVLAGVNSVHTWWVGILGCALFGVVFFEARLYADVTLQLFFVVTSAVGWWNWRANRGGGSLPVRRVRPGVAAVLLGIGALVAAGYGWLLHRYTDAYAPFLDSVILAFSVLGQFLLMDRRYDAWWCWLVVNTLAVPLYWTRGLHVTAFLYAAFWINALVALVRWRRYLARA